MESNLTGNNAPNVSPETSPAPQFVPEQMPDVAPTPEAPISSPEKSAKTEQLPVDHAGQAIVASATPQSPSGPIDLAQPVMPAVPAVADDNDIIESEWIDKIKQVISSTRNDPHARQREASLLMADYVLKRFGKKVGEPEG